MKLLTAKQKQWLGRKTIKEKEIYMFPRFGFTAYESPNYSSGEYLDTNPFTKSLDGQMFLVKEKINGFCSGNFYHKPLVRDFYLCEEELSRRGLIEILFLMVISFLPMAIYNCFKGGVSKIES